MQKRTQYYATFESFVDIRIGPSRSFPGCVPDKRIIRIGFNTANEGLADFQSDFLSAESRLLTRWFIAGV
jgi:hypothetical protein